MFLLAEQLSEGWVVREYSKKMSDMFDHLDKDYLVAAMMGYESAADYGDYFVENYNGFYSSLNYLHFHTREDAEKAREYIISVITARKLAGTLGTIDIPKKQRGGKNVS